MLFGQIKYQKYKGFRENDERGKGFVSNEIKRERLKIVQKPNQSRYRF